MSTDIVRAGALGPATLPQMIDYAEKLSNAGLLPAQYRKQPANVLFAMEYGRTLGITPVAAITGIHVIEGKPSASAGLIGALVRQAGHKLRVSGNDQRAVATIVRADDPDFEFRSEWTVDRAVRAGLCQLKDGRPFARDSKGKAKPWEAYTAAMLKARAITEVARDACEDVLFGLHYTPEELGAVVDQDGNPVDAPVQPLRAVDATPAPAAADPEAQALADRAAKASDRAAVTALSEEAKSAELDPNAAVKAPDTGEPDTLRAYLARRWKALPETAPAAPAEQTPAAAGDDEPLDVETVADGEDDHTQAIAELRALAAELRMDDIDRDAEGALGLPLAEASASAIRALTAQLRGNAA